MSDLGFEKMLAEQNAAYAVAEEFSDWMPDDGEYFVTVLKCSKGEKEYKGVRMRWWKLTARIEDAANETLDGQEFSLGFFNTNAPGILKTRARALNRGKAVPTLPEAIGVFEASVGEILRVKVATNDKGYKNCFVLEIIDAESAEAPDTVEVPQDGAVADTTITITADPATGESPF